MAGSWWLKLDRAEHHFVDLKSELGRYAKGHHYETVPIVGGPKCNEHVGCIRQRLRITEQPKDTVQAICGDILYNVRSALDHLAVALVPSNRSGNASFPIELQDIWARDKGRRYIVRDTERRRRFRTAVEGMDPKAVAVIKSIQPYALTAEASDSGLYVLNRLSNLDKHRKLIPLVPGLAHLIVDVNVRGNATRTIGKTVGPGIAFMEDGTQVVHLVPDPMLLPNVSHTEVNVRLEGALLIAIKVRHPSKSLQATGWMDVEALFRTLLEHMRNKVFPELEPFIHRR